MTAEDILRAHVRAALRNAGIRQVAAATELGISQKHLSQMLTGRVHLTLNWAEQILGVCGTTLVISIEQPNPEGTPVPDPTITDLRRELEKAREALTAAHKHLTAHAEMNAALHCATSVMYSPLHAKVVSAIAGIDHALKRTDRPNVPTLDSRSPDGPWAALAADLDRCVHGRHQGDACGDVCGSTSQGNPHLRPGQVIGYGLRGDRIVMPDREHKHDPAAWRTTPGPTS